MYRMGQFDGSINDYDESLRYATGDLRSQGFFNRGNAAFQTQQYLQAVEGYKEVLRMNPDDLDAKHNLELALRQLPPEAQDPQDEPPPPQDAILLLRRTNRHPLRMNHHLRRTSHRLRELNPHRRANR